MCHPERREGSVTCEMLIGTPFGPQARRGETACGADASVTTLSRTSEVRVLDLWLLFDRRIHSE